MLVTIFKNTYDIKTTIWLILRNREVPDEIYELTNI